jgi:hypothetical protein
VLLWVGAVAFQLWAAYMWAPDLTRAVRCTQSQDHGGQIVAVAEEGELLPVIETPVERTAATKAPIALVGSGVLLAGVIAIIGVALPHLALPVGDEKALFAGFVVAPRLLFPVCKNRYSAEDPLWAHAPTTLRVGLALCLILEPAPPTDECCIL